MVPEGESHLFHTLSLLHIFFLRIISTIKEGCGKGKKKKKGHNEGWTSKWEDDNNLQKNH